MLLLKTVKYPSGASFSFYRNSFMNIWRPFINHVGFERKKRVWPKMMMNGPLLRLLQELPPAFFQGFLQKKNPPGIHSDWRDSFRNSSCGSSRNVCCCFYKIFYVNFSDFFKIKNTLCELLQEFHLESWEGFLKIELWFIMGFLCFVITNSIPSGLWLTSNR